MADKFPLANFNCSFIDVTKWDDFLATLFYLLLVGTGVGFRGAKEQISKLPALNPNFTLVHEPYTPVPKEERAEHTTYNTEDGQLDLFEVVIRVGDSKEGWVSALRTFLSFIQDTDVKTIRINYDSIRPNGERLVTFGGTASGHEPLRDMFTGIQSVIRGELDPALEPLEVGENGKVHVRPCAYPRHRELDWA